MGEFELPEAFEKGKAAIKQTAMASFKIEPEGEIDLDIITQSYSHLPQNEFRISKKEKNVFIQKPTYRISSSGEKAEITAKGLQAIRRKKRRFQL
jgi:hypothetical protein